MTRTAQASLFPAKQSPVQEPWPLPSGWEWRELEFCVQPTERVDPTKEPHHLFPYIDIASVDAASGLILEPKMISGATAPSRARKVVRTNDVIFATTRPYLRNIAIVPPHLDKAVCSTGFCVLRAAENIEPSWLYWVCRSTIVISQLLEKMRGANYPAVTDTDVFSTSVPIPPSTIQRRIVARIEALLAELKEMRDLATAIRRDTERLLAAVVNEVFTSLHHVSKIIPLKEVATAFNGRASGEGNSRVRVFKTKHVYPHFLRLDRPSFMKAEQVQQLPKDRYLKPGDVLMANIAEGTLGRVSYIQECEESWTVDTQIMILRSQDERNLLLGKWLYYYLWSEPGQEEILARRSGIAFADKRGQTHIYPKNVLKIPVPVPPIEKQIQAVALLANVQTETEEMRHMQAQNTELFDQLEQSILERAFRGEL